MNCQIQTTEMHTGGEPVRIIESGFPPVIGSTILEKRQYAAKVLDKWRRLVMWEPRGHRDMYGALLVKPDLPEASIATLFLHNAGFSTMCGHAVIALARYAVDKGFVTPSPPSTPVNIQCPCGLVRAWVDSISSAVRFHSVPAFVFACDLQVTVAGYGRVTLDIAYGGAFYAILPASELGLSLQDKAHYERLVKAGTAVTEAVKQATSLSHPDSDQLAFLYGTIITDGMDSQPHLPTANICIFANEEVDRSPTGSGVTARIALQYSRGEVAVGQERVFQAINSSTFTGAVVKETQCGQYKAVIVEVGGKGHYMGQTTFTLENDDPFPEGFLLQ